MREVSVGTLTVALSDERLNQLQELARRLGVAPEDLIRLSVEELLARPAEDFARVADYLIKKNADLYRRLA